MPLLTWLVSLPSLRFISLTICSGEASNDASCQQSTRNGELRRFSSTSWTFTWLQPWPTSGLQPQEKPWAKTIHLSHFQFIRNRNDEMLNVCCFKAMSFGVISYTIIAYTYTMYTDDQTTFGNKQIVIWNKKQLQIRLRIIQILRI